jgi:hypothetical protein
LTQWETTTEAQPAKEEREDLAEWETMTAHRKMEKWGVFPTWEERAASPTREGCRLRRRRVRTGVRAGWAA